MPNVEGVLESEIMRLIFFFIYHFLIFLLQNLRLRNLMSQRRETLNRAKTNLDTLKVENKHLTEEHLR